MHRSSSFFAAASIGMTITLVQPAATAKSPLEALEEMQGSSVKIKLQQKKGVVGSGVIIHRQGDLYTVVTNGHVVCGINYVPGQLCTRLPIAEVYNLTMVDRSTGLPTNESYRVKASNVKLLGKGKKLDLAIIQFRSSRNYAVAKVALPGSVKIKDNLFTTGFALDQPGLSMGLGEAVAVVNKRLIQDGGGYTIVYNAGTLPGMSGGGVFNEDGQLVALHGVGEQERKNTYPRISEVTNLLGYDQSGVGSKIGYNRGIPIRWIVESLVEVGINLGGREHSSVKNSFSQRPTSADEYFIAGFNKWIDPGVNVLAGKQQAIQELSNAIKINPKYEQAYFIRAIVYRQVRDFRKSLSDYNTGLLLNPKSLLGYFNRAALRGYDLNDLQGALVDYNQTIVINPAYFEAYVNRAILKEKLSDLQGAMADYNQAIILKPQSTYTYVARGVLKEKLSDKQGALDDYN
jgi:tetratricopeptide (TPR) repeat protein